MRRRGASPESPSTSDVEALEPRDVARPQGDVVDPHDAHANAQLVTTGHAPHVVVATHGHCFDGLCSAVMFTRLYRHLLPGRRRDASPTTPPATARARTASSPKVLAGDVNAILDFRFSPLPQLDWYFDHHVSAFVTPEDRADYERRAAAQGADGRAPLLPRRRVQLRDEAHRRPRARALRPRSRRRRAELVRWADMIDSAAFPSAKMAVERAEPELQLMTVVEHLGDDAFLARMVPRLLEQPLADVARAAGHRRRRTSRSAERTRRS